MIIDIILLAAKANKKLRKCGAKPIIKISSRQTILQRQVSILKKYFNKFNLHLVVGFRQDEIIQHAHETYNRINIIENKEYDNLNIAHSIKLGLQQTTRNNIMIMYGDLVFSRHIFDKTNFCISNVFIENYKNLHNRSIGCIINNGQLQNMMWNIPDKWCQIAFFSKREAEILRQLDINSRHFTYQIINNMIENGGKFNAEKIKGHIIDVDTTKDIKKANEICKKY